MAHSFNIDHRTGRKRRWSAAERVDPARRALGQEPLGRLAWQLADVVAGEVRFDEGTRALYSTDASNYRQVPLGVVVPKSIEDVVATVNLCCQHEVPVLPRGGGTSLAGQTCNVAVVIDFSKYLDRVVDIDPSRRLARVEPGCVLDYLRHAAEAHHLTFGPDPATHDRNSLGGMLGNNSCGVHSVMAGRTSDNVEELEILTYDGERMRVGRTSEEAFAAIARSGGRRAEIYRDLRAFGERYGALIREQYPRIPRRVSGYENLDELLPENGFNVARALVGTEATCVTILSATLNLVQSPQHRALVIVGFDDVFAAADAVPDVLKYGPIGLEGMDDMLIDFMRRKGLGGEDIELLPHGDGWLMAEFGGKTPEEASGRARTLAEAYGEKGRPLKLLSDPHKQSRIWNVREAGLAATAHVPDMPEAYPGWEDSAVGRDQLGHYLRDLKALFARYGYRAAVYGHFGDGLVHCRIPFDLESVEGLRDWQRFLDEAADLAARYKGSISGEHGDGQARGALLERMYGSELVQAFREFKAIWDPGNRMNPGKVVDPFPPTTNLRIGPHNHPVPIRSAYAYPEDHGSFAAATRRCVGVGKCRRTDSDEGVMCPSYMVTRDEQHSTRGRARLLFEMLEGNPLADGWRSRAVEEALDLCLACKGCKSDCPVHVDMATYKSEFRARYYAGRLRPRAAYSMGLIHIWARLAAHVPRFSNAAMRLPWLSDALKLAGGISAQRNFPSFAVQPFTDWFRSRRPAPQRGERVLLWPDTFNNYFRPQAAIAATRVLEHLGFDVVIPDRPLCCGRALYDWGMIGRAKSLWRATFESLSGEIEAGTPVVCLEPACASAFLDELPNLFPGNHAARRLQAQAVFLSDFVADRLAKSDHLLGRVDRPVISQTHCHQHSIIGDGESRLLDRLGVRADVLPSGCCGMAGSFGFESAKYDLSIKLAERVLFPRLRDAPADVIVLANGFSCREQIEQGLEVETMHVAELLASALPDRPGSH